MAKRGKVCLRYWIVLAWTGFYTALLVLGPWWTDKQGQTDTSLPLADHLQVGARGVWKVYLGDLRQNVGVENRLDEGAWDVQAGWGEVPKQGLGHPPDSEKNQRIRKSTRQESDSVGHIPLDQHMHGDMMVPIDGPASDTGSHVDVAPRQLAGNNGTNPAKMVDDHMKDSVVSKDRSPNNTIIKPKLNVRRVIYNRVPKCGSRSVTQVFHSAAKQNMFHLNASNIYGQWRLRDHQEERSFIDHIMSLETPLVYDRHIQFVNFTRHGKKQPLFVNVVREPIERFISDYHYVREEPTARNKLPAHVRNVTIDDCVSGRAHKRCTWSGLYTIYIRFFCGQDDICNDGSHAGLAQAKRNIVKYYPIIGLTEDLQTFFSLLEYTMPSLFTGTSNFYRDTGAAAHEKTKTTSKPDVTEETRSKLRENLSLDYELYDFIHQRYHKQKAWLEQLNNH